jgi:carboxyl-terminal processing protease
VRLGFAPEHPPAPAGASFTIAAAPTELTPKDRLAALDDVWKTIRDHYYDRSFNGVDWNAVRDRYRPRAEAAQSDGDLYAALKEMTRELHDAHTSFLTPDEWERRQKKQATTIGIGIAEVEGTLVVSGVMPDSEAATAGVEAGMAITAIDGAPIAERLQAAAREIEPSSSDRATRHALHARLLAGDVGQSLRLTLRRADGTSFDAALPRWAVPADPPSLRVTVLSSGFARINVSRFDVEVVKPFYEGLAKVARAPGLILDMRGNPGGRLTPVLDIADRFFAKKVSFGKLVTRSGKGPSLYLRMLGVPWDLDVHGRSSRHPYGGPVVILVNDWSASAAELFASGMQETGRAAIVGQQTVGAVLGAASFPVKGGGRLGVSMIDIRTTKGQRLEGTGVLPDKTVPMTLNDLRSHRDAALAAAVEILKAAAKTAPAAVQQPARPAKIS